MDPEAQFKERYDAFIKTRQAQTNKAPLVPKKNNPFNKFYLLGLLLGAFIILPGVFMLLRNNAQQGTPSAPPVTTKQQQSQAISEDEIYQELVGMTGSSAKESLKNPELVARARKSILKRRALQKLTAASGQIAESAETKAPNYSLGLLQTEMELEKKVVSSRTADYVSTYVAPTGDYKTQEKIVKENLEFIRAELVKGRTVTQAYNALVTKLGTNPQYNVQQNAYVTKTSGYSSGYITALFKAKTGDVTPVVQSNGTDFMVAKIISAVDTKYNSFDAWEKENLE